MNAKRIWFFLPAILLPFCAMNIPAVIFSSSNNTVTGYIMDVLFQGNPLLFVVALLLYGLLAAIFSIIGFIKSIRNNWDSLSLAKFAIILKLFYLPSYGIIAILSTVLAFSLMIFPLYIILLWPIPLSLLLINTLTLFISNLITTAAVINANRNNLFPSKASAWIIILQQFFYIDAVVAIVLYIRLKKRKITLSKQGDNDDSI